MGSVNDWGAIAAGLLAVECLVLNLIWLALAIGLWKGFGWLHDHASPAFQKLTGYLNKGQRAIEKGTTMVAQPVIKARSGVEGVRTAVAYLRKEKP